MNKRIIGGNKEEVAVAFLLENNYEIICRNFTCKSGEIDIIAKDGKTLCFIEVKYRKNSRYGYAVESINIKKQQKIYRCANLYLMKNNMDFYSNYRFDVVAIQGENIEIIKNAFGVM